MKRPLFKSIAFCAMLFLAAAGIASGSALSPLQSVPPANPAADPTINVPFPTAGDAYVSATLGSGTIPSGGQTAFQWTAGDYVQSAVFTLPTTTISDLSANWQFQDDLDGTTETWFVYVNGVAVAQAFLPDDSGAGDIRTVTGEVGFAPILSPTGTFQVELILQSTVPLGGGSVAWLDGGTTGLSYTPEPGSILLLGSGLAFCSLLLRRKRSA